ncbi:MAG: hypothetical protein ACFFC7_15320 [Candidatus Hermodarchaeota archaeon]
MNYSFLNSLLTNYLINLSIIPLYMVISSVPQLFRYRAGFEIEQERINMTVAKNWPYPRVITVDQLREKYYKDDFDPQTVLYCFDDNNGMIGFVTSQILEKENEIVRARLSFPIVLPGYKDAIELLFERAIKVLKDKNIQIVHSSFGLWGGSNEWAEKWGYKRIDEIGVLYGLDVNSNTFNEETEDIIPFDPETDLNDCVNLFVTEYNLPEDDVRNFTRYILAKILKIHRISLYSNLFFF